MSIIEFLALGETDEGFPQVTFRGRGLQRLKESNIWIVWQRNNRRTIYRGNDEELAVKLLRYGDGKELR